jgi:hypothetical protein
MRIEARLEEMGLTLPEPPRSHQECKYIFRLGPGA